MDYTMVAKLLRKQKRLLEKKLQECMEQEDNNNASKQAEVEKLLTKIASKEKAIQTALDQMKNPVTGSNAVEISNYCQQVTFEFTKMEIVSKNNQGRLCQIPDQARRCF